MSQESRPFDGVVVVDLSQATSGPYCTMLLADLGAEVVKIEPSGTGEASRKFAPIPKPGQESGYYMYLNRNKKSIEVDYNNPRMLDVIYKLCEKADIVIENDVPGKMAGMKLGYEDIKTINPQIIYASITGFGQTGPLKDHPYNDFLVQSMSGIMTTTGFPEGPPMKMGPALAELNAGIHTALALASALVFRDETGKGQYIDIAMLDCEFSTMENSIPLYTYGGTTPFRNGNCNLAGSPFNSYKTIDSYVIIAVATDSNFNKLCEIMGRSDLIGDERYDKIYKRKDEQIFVDSTVEEWTKRHTTAEVVEILEQFRIPCGSIFDIDQVCNDPHIKSRDMFITMDHPKEGKFTAQGNPLKFSDTKVDTFVPAPLLGQDTEAVLLKCGFEKDVIDALSEEGVVGCHSY